VHIGNIRAAIFNWLFARHEGGKFLLRVEDTDLERSTPEAVRTLLESMQWLGLDVDEEPMYQTAQLAAHRQAAERLIAAGKAYRFAKGGAGEAVVFRIPWDAEQVPGVSVVGPAELDVHPDTPVTVDHRGVNFALVSAKGKPMPQAACLAGFRDLEILDAQGGNLFRLTDRLDAIRAGTDSATVERAAKLRYTRRQIAYDDIIKGHLAKPLDSMQDQVIVRSDGAPVFHLANVCDDITQGTTHIIRGDDHVENTYRHIFLFHALGATPPRYAHLPMIVNAQGKPFSKRDGDAYVGDFRGKGFLAEALFNYLTLLGWSPGDDREKLTRAELIQLFTLERCLSSSAQMDLRKLTNLNGQYLAEMAPDAFVAQCRQHAAALPWYAGADSAYFERAARLLQSRTKAFSQVSEWDYLFNELPVYDEKAVGKFLKTEPARQALARAADALKACEFTAAGIEAAIHGVTQAAGIEQGQLNQPLRVAVTGRTVGAGLYETMELLGRARTLRRLEHALSR
jgi:glutamyl-tRNA synthetase